MNGGGAKWSEVDKIYPESNLIQNKNKRNSKFLNKWNRICTKSTVVFRIHDNLTCHAMLCHAILYVSYCIILKCLTVCIYFKLFKLPILSIYHHIFSIILFLLVQHHLIHSCIHLVLNNLSLFVHVHHHPIYIYIYIYIFHNFKFLLFDVCICLCIFRTE